jgi:valyl-tRNA synthetase
MPDKPSLDGLEAKWSQVWDESGVYRFDRTKTRADVYSIDTPPPTVSGSLHVGHVFSYTHTDTVARYRRMCGREVFYPMGWDDNGLPTERRVQNHFGVRCDPALPYDADFVPSVEPAAGQKVGKSRAERVVSVSRRNFVELCERLTREDERAFEELWRLLGLSVDWTMTYQTVDAVSRTASQRAFLRNLDRGEAYSAEAPTLWDVTFRTAVAQAESEDREHPGAYHLLVFRAPGGDPVQIATTRPELLPACVALVAHPDDTRYTHLFGGSVRTPLFHVDVPVYAHPLADPEKGSGIAMVCTFGDTTDVTWWRELRLDTRAVLGWDGRLRAEPPTGVDTAQGREAYARIAGATVFTARERIVALLRESGELVGEPRAITHPVKFYEKGDRPLEIVTTRQWYLRNGGRDADLRDRLLARGDELAWHPAHMKVRYDTWVAGLNGDWLISRQRFFGVPVPLWYPLDAAGQPRHDAPIRPEEARLPIDPYTDVPTGYRAEQRGEPGGFVGDLDVMDTWATSSLTPQIAGGWCRDDDLFRRVFPMDLRPQAHEIIRTWLFSSVVRANSENHSLPFRHAAISGWILDPDRKKMSKSKGNVVTPIDLLARHGSDAVRYWAASGRPGVDTAFDVGQMKVGRRLAIKLLNVGRFALSIGATSASTAAPTDPLDLALLAELADVVRAATDAFEDYDYARALARTERFFWYFCDDYVELVKSRAYGETGAGAGMGTGTDAGAASARGALGAALSVLLRLFAPFLPFATEEVWSWWQEGSVHRAAWPVPEAPEHADRELLATASDLIAEVRKAKSRAQVSMRAEVPRALVTGDAAALARLALIETDLRAAGRIALIERVTGDGPLTVDVTLEN